MGNVNEITNISNAWEKFITCHVIDEALVRPEIAYSWQRCNLAGVDPYSGVSQRILNPQQLENLLNKKRNLINIAKPCMINLYKFVAGSGFIVMLSDEHGYIMEVIGDEDTMKNASELNLSKGASWLEEVVGTNGIGTALAIKKPIQVSGAEHYCQKVHFWTCSAAPIFDNNENVVGVLQMSGPSFKTHQHTLGMLVAAVESIYNQIKLQEKNRELILLNNRLTNIIQTASDGILAVNKEGLIEQLNPAAEKILLIKEEEIKDNLIFNLLNEITLIKEMLTEGKTYKESEIILTTVNGNIHCLSSGKPIKDVNGEIIGGVIFINPINKIKKLVNRFSGAHATFQFENIVGTNKQLLKAIELAKIASESNCHVILEGESGTGKEVFAQSIHNFSQRQNGPFIAINCGAIPRELVGSELFGYEGGSFTGAKSGGRPGKFEMASGGTLFLDEIGEMPLEHQVALLRVLQDKTITRIGGSNTIFVDVRIICASNKKLSAEVAKGNFRQDLFFRLNVIKIALPPLRERREDIPLLFDTFLKEVCQKSGTSFPTVDPEIITYLMRYNWPGNIREFQNVVERMVYIANGQKIELKHLPEEISIPLSNNLSKETINSHTDPNTYEEFKINKMLENNERQEIINQLVAFHGNVSHVAKAMGISRNSLYKKLKKFNISRK